MVANKSLAPREGQGFPLDIFREIGYTLGMTTLTNRQVEICTAIREIAPPPENKSWGDYLDFIRAVAAMIDGAQTLTRPCKIQRHFQAAWEACAKLWVAENNRILRDCLGGQEGFDAVRAHPNGQNAFGRILKRVRDTHGDMSPGMTVEVKVDDILFDLDIIE